MYLRDHFCYLHIFEFAVITKISVGGLEKRFSCPPTKIKIFIFKTFHKQIFTT